MNPPAPTDGQDSISQHGPVESQLDPDLSRSPSASARTSFDRGIRKQNDTPVQTANSNDPQKVILESFQPRLFVLASQDTEELIRLKGIYGGLAGLLRPFGERIQGNVIARDSSGSSKNLAPYGVHFVPFNRLQPPGADSGSQRTPSMSWSNDESIQSTIDISSSKLQEQSSVMEGVLRHQLSTSQNPPKQHENSRQPASLPHYAFYLRRLLGGRHLIPHEPYTHPVACVIAISSQNPAPLEALRDLYDNTRQGSRDLPAWMSNEFLRYYILVHDEDHDDVNRSMALFDQMKRHFGLHCHMLRLRSTPCGPQTPDTMQLPQSNWLSASEEAADMERKQLNSGIDEFKQYLYNSDAALLRTFVREMVTQSIIPFMEGRINAWNDQVASRRRGISGRFMTLSKRFAFGSGRGAKAATNNTNYNATFGAYMPESAEAVMHRLADYAFMLGDWKLASSTYDMLRSDFTDDKSWRHSAFSNEMAALSSMLLAQGTTSLKTDTIDLMLDSATYSYITRCQDPTGALRCLLLAAELLKSHGRTGIQEAAKWSDRLLELSLLSPSAQCLFSERVAFFFQLSPHVGAIQYSSQTRKAALWNLLSTEVWLLNNNSIHAKECLGNAKTLYALSKSNDKIPPFETMNEKWDDLYQRLAKIEKNEDGQAFDVEEEELDEVREDLVDTGEVKRGHQHRLSMGYQPKQEDVREMLSRFKDPLTDGDDGFT